jgi:hypothetical protein
MRKGNTNTGLLIAILVVIAVAAGIWAYRQYEAGKADDDGGLNIELNTGGNEPNDSGNNY